MVKDSDLSEYELLRLENIRRNAEFLAQLGIQPLAVKVKEQKDQEESIKKKKKAEKVVRNVKPTSPIVLRRSSRNSGKVEDLAKLPDNWNENGTKIKVKAEKAGISYEDQPMESDELDDHEFQAFVQLRKWRLMRCRELDIEPYKIFQNRTLCELVRHRRNDVHWAASSSGSDSTSSSGDGGVTADTSSNTLEPLTSPVVSTTDITAPSSTSNDVTQSAQLSYDATIADALTDCWGVGPAKVKEGGFGWEVLEVLNSAEITALLEQSRALGDGTQLGHSEEQDVVTEAKL